MANSSIKITRKNIYTIDIKDESNNVFHTLEIHYGDTNFPIKMMKLYDEAFKQIDELKTKEDELKKEILEEGHKEVPEITNITADNITMYEDVLSPAMKKFYRLEAEGYDHLRKILDEFLGKGTCEAIFGEYNDKEEFADFLNGLLPEFEKMGVKMQDIQKNMYKKYAPKTNKVI